MSASIVLSLPQGPRLNLGCGHIQPREWVNIDGSNRAWLASRVAPLDRLLVKLGILGQTEFGPTVKVCDLLKRLPYADGSVSAIYASELWEHFTCADAARLTRECFRILAPGGVLRICVPDGVAFWREYLRLHDEVSAMPRAARSAKSLRDHVQSYFRCIATKRIWLGSLGHTHKWQYDDIQLIELFESVGFTQVERRAYHDSRIPGIDAIECYDFLIVEGVKPAAPAAEPALRPAALSPAARLAEALIFFAGALPAASLDWLEGALSFSRFAVLA